MHRAQSHLRPQAPQRPTPKSPPPPPAAAELSSQQLQEEAASPQLEQSVQIDATATAVDLPLENTGEDGSAQPPEESSAPAKEKKAPKEKKRAREEDEPAPAPAVAAGGKKPWAPPPPSPYEENDMRNPACASLAFRDAVTEMQNAPFKRTVVAESADGRRFRFKVSHFKGTVDQLIESDDGEVKWQAIAYATTAAALDPYNANSQKKDKFGLSDYYLSANVKDVPETATEAGVTLPPELFRFDNSGTKKMPAPAAKKGAKFAKKE